MKCSINHLYLHSWMGFKGTWSKRQERVFTFALLKMPKGRLQLDLTQLSSRFLAELVLLEMLLQPYSITSHFEQRYAIGLLCLPRLPGFVQILVAIDSSGTGFCTPSPVTHMLSIIIGSSSSHNSSLHPFYS